MKNDKLSAGARAEINLSFLATCTCRCTLWIIDEIIGFGHEIVQNVVGHFLFLHPLDVLVYNLLQAPQPS